MAPGNKRDTHFTTEDLKSLGYHVCDTLLDFCDPDRTKVKTGFQDMWWCHCDHCHTGPKSAQWGYGWSLFSSSYFSEVFIIKESKKSPSLHTPSRRYDLDLVPPRELGPPAPSKQPPPPHSGFPCGGASASFLPPVSEKQVSFLLSKTAPALAALAASPVVSLSSCLISYLFSVLGLFVWFFFFPLFFFLPTADGLKLPPS